MVTTALVATGLVVVASQAPAQAAPTGSVIVYQCGTSVCAIDPDVAGSERVVATNAYPAGVTRDGLTAGVVDRSTNQVRTIALAAGGVDRVMANPGSADRPDFAAISDSGSKSGWVWYYADLGWYAQVAPAGGTWTAQASSTSQVSIGWRGEDLLTSRRGASGFDSRICIEVAGGPACDQRLVSEPDRSQQLAFPDIDPAGTTLVAVRGPEGTGFGLPYYGALALYGVGSTSGPARVLTNGPDSQPEFSNEGDRVVFERQDQGIFVVGTDGGGLRKIADGSTPFWGGNRTDTPPPPPPPPANAAPVGSYDAANGGAGVIRVAGWGFDPTVPGESIDVHVYIGGTAGVPGADGKAISANLVREDVNQANGITGKHGFDVDLRSAKRGSVPVCVYLIDRPIGVNTFLGCKDVTLTGPTARPLTIRRVLPVARAARSVGVQLRCPATHRTGCAGRLTIRSVAKLKLPGKAARRLVVAQGSYRLEAGQQRVVRIKLTRTGRRTLARFASFRAEVSVRSTRPAGQSARKVVVVKRRR